MTIAAAMMPPISSIFSPKPNHTQTTADATIPFANPFAKPTKTSLISTRREFFQVTSPSASPRTITAGAHLLFVAKNLERIGDHATNIAEMVYYAATGERLAERVKGQGAADAR